MTTTPRAAADSVTAADQKYRQNPKKNRSGGGARSAFNEKITLFSSFSVRYEEYEKLKRYSRRRPSDINA